MSTTTTTIFTTKTNTTPVRKIILKPKLSPSFRNELARQKYLKSHRQSKDLEEVKFISFIKPKFSRKDRNATLGAPPPTTIHPTSYDSCAKSLGLKPEQRSNYEDPKYPWLDDQYIVPLQDGIFQSIRKSKFGKTPVRYFRKESEEEESIDLFEKKDYESPGRVVDTPITFIPVLDDPHKAFIYLGIILASQFVDEEFSIEPFVSLVGYENWESELDLAEEEMSVFWLYLNRERETKM
jgi:hypothetical protein